MRHLSIIVAIGAACASTSEQVESPPPAVDQQPKTPATSELAVPKSLYERLGGLPAIEAVVTEFYKNVTADERINAPFAIVDLKRLRGLLVDFVCSAAGGPCKYTGRSMKESHLNMGVTSEQFDVLVAHLGAALEKFNVPEKEKNELLGALGPLKVDIVEVP